VKARNITPENTVFVIVSFEGRDPYSLAGGLGVRVANLSYRERRHVRVGD